MGRVSRAQAEHNRQRVLDEAARLFRERGVQGVSVAELMAGAGLTHGGFYRRFASKDALVAEAVGRAFAEQGGQLGALDESTPGGHPAARAALVASYLTAGHRDAPGEGCPAAALAVDVAREAPASPARAPYAEGVEAFARWLSADGDGEDLAALSTLVGALVLARATRDTPVSDRILAAARAALG